MSITDLITALTSKGSIVSWRILSAGKTVKSRPNGGQIELESYLDGLKPGLYRVQVSASPKLEGWHTTQEYRVEAPESPETMLMSLYKLALEEIKVLKAQIAEQNKTISAFADVRLADASKLVSIVVAQSEASGKVIAGVNEIVGGTVEMTVAGSAFLKASVEDAVNAEIKRTTTAGAVERIFGPSLDKMGSALASGVDFLPMMVEGVISAGK